jgi:beta-glucosidase
MSFKDDFIWGAAAASYQIEGAWNADGKGLSVWDVFTEAPGKVYQGHTGKTACNHYEHYKNDISLMKEIGIQSYRFSISWPRVLPEGRGKVNEQGLDFYSRLVDELLAQDIVPFPTLFHWDFPYELYCKGGWQNRDSAQWFAEYTQVMVDKLSDRVNHWFTLNEPTVFVGLGHQEGRHAPGLKLQERDIIRIYHNVLLAHGWSVQVIRERSQLDAQVGMAPVCSVAMPASEKQADIDAAYRSMFEIPNRHAYSGWQNSWLLDPVFFGKYPEDGLRLAESFLPKGYEKDLPIINQPIDFLGTNHYSGYFVKADSAGNPQHISSPVGEPLTNLKWRVTPEGLYWGPRFLYERYKKPIYITENGLSNQDWVSLDGKVHDPQRIDFTQRYLRELRRAAADGADIRGYFHWSIMDNFEWAEGYKERFGLIYVDYETQERILKDSAHWYKSVIETKGENL